MTDFTYPGAELDLFAAAQNWKRYWSAQVRHYIAGDVLEVGAGLGSNTPFLDAGGCGRWVCLEPDAGLASQLTKNLAQSGRGGSYEVVSGTIKDLDQARKFDTIIYIDVLEHIEDDQQEMRNAADLLRPGGRIIVLSPAHQSLFTPFDEAIGHFRRYNRATLSRTTPPGLRIEKMIYLDSAGLLLSSANRLLLKQSMPTKAQLRVWDTIIIPVSRVLDRCLFNAAGKTIVGVWRRE